MNLAQLNQLALDYNIPSEEIHFDAGYKSVYVYGLEKYLPDPSKMEENEEGEFPELEAICKKYGISPEEGNWFFYT
jgi:hypothetical protein